MQVSTEGVMSCPTPERPRHPHAQVYDVYSGSLQQMWRPLGVDASSPITCLHAAEVCGRQVPHRPQCGPSVGTGHLRASSRAVPVPGVPTGAMASCTQPSPCVPRSQKKF